MLVLEMSFNDKCSLMANTEEVLQEIIDRFATACCKYGLTTNLKKVMLQLPPCYNYTPMTVAINCTKLNTMDQFTNLGRSANLRISMLKYPMLSVKHVVPLADSDKTVLT